MGLLQTLPTQEHLSNILAPVLGDEATGTGVAGVLSHLREIDTLNLSELLASELDQQVSVNLSVDTGVLTEDALGQFERAIAAIPKDPTELLNPLGSKLEDIRSLSTTDLSTQLLAGVNGLQNVGSLVPANTDALVAGVAEGLIQLKRELISGQFGELRQWSESVQELYAEIEPLLSGGSGTLEDRLLTHLREKITDLARIILPQDSLGLTIASQLDAAFSADKLTAIDALKTELIDAMNQARIDLDQGNLTNTTHLAAAQASFQQLTKALEDITGLLGHFFDREIANADGLARALEQQFDDFAQIEIIDLGNIKDHFVDAIERLEQAIESLNLDVVRETIEEVFAKISDAIGQFDLGQLTKRLSGLQNQLQTVLNALDAALFQVVASIRNSFVQIRNALQSVAGVLGEYDQDGTFHFHIEQEIVSFLNTIKSALEDTIQPILKQFKNTIGQTLQTVQDGLNAVKVEIEGVKTQLTVLLQGARDQLQTLNIESTMQGIQEKLEGMLGELNAIDFDPVVDPVIAQINEMRDALAEIDVSTLSDFTVGALKVSVEVVIDLDFTSQITDALLDELDELLETPKSALDEIEANVESALQRFGDLAPKELLAPLDDLFEPITAQLDALELDTLTKPLDAWYGRMQQEMDKISPVALLQPLIDLYSELQDSFTSVSPVELIRPLEQVIDEVKTEIQAIDITSIAAELSAVIDEVKGLLDGISPARLLNPLVNAFDKIMGALDRFDPTTLLQPFTDTFDALTAPLENLTADHVRLLAEAFAALRALLDAFNPHRLYLVIREKTGAVRDMLQQLDIGGLIAALNAPYQALYTAFETQAGSASVSLSASVEGLNPLHNDTLGQAATNVQRFQAQLDGLAQAEPSTELIQRYNDDIKNRLESLIPSWANENISPDSVRRAFRLANPLNIAEDVKQLWEAIKDQLRNFDPRILQEKLETLFTTLQDSILSLDSQALVDQVQDMIGALSQRLDAVDLGLIVRELEGLEDEIKTVIAGLDPQPLFQQLENLAEEVMGLVIALQPSEILGELEVPFQAAKEVVSEFDPAAFASPLLEVFEEILATLGQIDVGMVLQPLVKRLTQLRDELEEGLRRTEVAFNGMLRAIPV